MNVSTPHMLLITAQHIICTDLIQLSRSSVSGGRLECTMQNIADNYYNTYSSRCCIGVEGILLFFFIFHLSLTNDEL